MKNALLVPLLLALLCSSLAAADPTIVSTPETFTVDEGTTVIMRCQVSNLGTNKVIWKYVSKDLEISVGTALYSNQVKKYSIISAQDGSVYNLQILGVDQNDDGFYKCYVDGTSASITYTIEIIGIADLQPAAVSQNKTACCQSKGVEDSCLPACVPTMVNMTTFDPLASCASPSSLPGLSECFTAGSNYDHCCLKRGLNELCLPFCHNEIPALLTIDHLTKCYNSTAIDTMFGCFRDGAFALPNSPTNVQVISVVQGSQTNLLVKWQKPDRNPDMVIGYSLFYKLTSDKMYKSISIIGQTTDYQLSNVQVNVEYHVYVIANAQQGVSLPSTTVSIFVPDPSLQDKQNLDIDECCSNRKVSADCRNGLCRSKTWTNFDLDNLGSCLGSMNDVFGCLVAEQNHTGCCAAYGVPDVCMQLCSGKPPTFDDTLLTCVYQLPVIEACAQQGYSKLPGPPQSLELTSVDITSAIFSFKPPKSKVQPTLYRVQVQAGGSNADFTNMMTLTTADLAFSLVNLTANTFYSVRMVGETATEGSLPSNTVRFLTYPDPSGIQTVQTPVNIPHNTTECCFNKGMPDLCAKGCQYSQTITGYYYDKLDLCYSSIGSVLSCSADGRDHRDCCRRRGVQETCLDLCSFTMEGQLDPKYQVCLADTAKAVMCHEEGLISLPRYPTMMVANVTAYHISLSWTHPETGGLVETYIIYYWMAGSGTKNNVTLTSTNVILNDLKPATLYEITAMSTNENGTSAYSPTIKQYTTNIGSDIPVFNNTEAAKQFWQNVTHCCENSVSDECVDFCLNKKSAASTSDACMKDSQKIFHCHLDGNDHSACCKARPDLPKACYPLCSGIEVDDTQFALCMSLSTRNLILGCIDDNKGLIPGPPKEFSITSTKNQTVTLTWIKPGFCDATCNVIVYYWPGKMTNPDNLTIKKEQVNGNTYTTPKLDPGYYTFAAVAQNNYGIGPPTAQETVYISSQYDRQVAVLLQSQTPYVEENQRATLLCDIVDFNPNDPYTIKWNFNEGRQVGQSQRQLVLERVSYLRDEGIYTCSVTDSTGTVKGSLYLPIKATPSVSEIRDTPVAPGNDAVIACWYTGYPDSSSQLWKMNGFSVPNNTLKYQTSIDSRYHTGITSYRLKIYNVTSDDYALYTIRASNKFGGSECQIKFIHPGDVFPVIPPKAVADIKGCCAKKGVSSVCQELCALDVDVADAISDSRYNTCLPYFEDLIVCGADGRDHSLCCKKEGVQPYCIPFCYGLSPDDINQDPDMLLTCVSESKTILQCAEKGHKMIPYPPHIVVLVRHNAQTTITVLWNPPKLNYHLINSYDISYYTNLDSHPNTTSVNAQIKQFIIKKANPNATYYMYVVAKNKWGPSQPSKVMESVPTKPPTPPTVPVPRDVKIKVVGTEIIMTWSPPLNTLVQAYNVFIFLNDSKKTLYSKVQMKKGKTKYVHFFLKEDVAYIVQLSTIDQKGFESARTKPLTFKTGSSPTSSPNNGDGNEGGDSGSGSGSGISKGAAIGVGTTMGTIALLGIIMLVFFFVRKGKFQFKRNSNDTVAFENPSYGNQGGVQIHGVASKGQFSYNQFEGASTDPQPDPVYDNPSFSTDQVDTNAATLPVTSEM